MGQAWRNIAERGAAQQVFQGDPLETVRRKCVHSIFLELQLRQAGGDHAARDLTADGHRLQTVSTAVGTLYVQGTVSYVVVCHVPYYVTDTAVHNADDIILYLSSRLD